MRSEEVRAASKEGAQDAYPDAVPAAEKPSASASPSPTASYTTVYNDGNEPFDPACAGGIADGLIDAQGRRFDEIDALYSVRGNEGICSGEELQPGFTRKVLYVYRVPDSAKPAMWSFSNSETFDDQSTLVRLR
ncbi:hypothetical protein [Streptomyces apocyni]|uniref:hypothetical protein n=1 Tax=Streptomyces apocyni TaxID=2654677 RepID=UPI0012EA984B|nr:hypothetical protein [Streptomyces apocyni]